MKKSLVLLLPLIITLTACEFTITQTSDVHSAGLASNNVSFSSNYVENNYEYFAGDDVDTSNPNVERVTFNVTKSQSNLLPTDVASLLNYSKPGFVVNADETYNVGTKEEEGLFVGADSTYVDGYLTLSFNEYVKAVVIDACPYFYMSNSWNEDQLMVDSNVAIAINNSRYIKVSGTIDTNTNEPITSECRYKLPDGTNLIKIKVGQRRAFIRRISLYF